MSLQSNTDQLNVSVVNRDLSAGLRNKEKDVGVIHFLSHTVVILIPEQNKPPVSVNRTLMNIYQHIQNCSVEPF